jgi:hypothetical protein
MRDGATKSELSAVHATKNRICSNINTLRGRNEKMRGIFGKGLDKKEISQPGG